MKGLVLHLTSLSSDEVAKEYRLGPFEAKVLHDRAERVRRVGLSTLAGPRAVTSSSRRGAGNRWGTSFTARI